MPFNEANKNFLNKELFVYPIPGYGWQVIETNNSHSIEPLDKFQIKIIDFFCIEEKLAVAYGTIVDKNSHFLNWWVALTPVLDDSNLKLDIETGPCGTLICAEKPNFDSSIRPLNSSKIAHTSIVPRYRGISYVGLSLDMILKKVNPEK